MVMKIKRFCSCERIGGAAAVLSALAASISPANRSTTYTGDPYTFNFNLNQDFIKTFLNPWIFFVNPYQRLYLPGK